MSAPAPVPGQAPAARRTALWVGGCGALLVIALLLAGISGVVIVLLSRRADPVEPTPELSTARGEGFSFTYPAAWDELEQTAPDADADEILALATPNGPTTISVYRWTSDQHAVSACAFQAGFISFDMDSSEEPEELDSAALGGRVAAHHRVRGKVDGRDAVSELWCVDDGTDVVLLVGRTRGSTERAPEVQTVLDSWTWSVGG